MAYFAPHFPFARAPAPSYHFYHSPPPTPCYRQDDLDVEEAAALAHLRSIQQRREAAALARREAAIRAQAQREAAIAAALERERLREEAIRREAIRREIARRQAFERERQTRQARYEDALRRRNACARRCRGVCGRNGEDNNTNTDLNGLLNALFGINLFTEAEQADSQADSQAEPGQPPQSIPQPTPQVQDKPEPVKSVEAAPSTEKVEFTESTGPKAEESKKSNDNTFPSDLNQLLSSFLGVQINPAAENEKSTEGCDDLVKNLNRFLGQFGLEFEPTSVDESSRSTEKEQVKDNTKSTEAEGSTSTSAQPAITTDISKSASASDPTPITTFLNSATDIPPFARDILSNVESAFNESRKEEEVVEGKGKGVAEGEKKVTASASAPVDAVPIPTTVEPANTVDESENTSSAESIDKLSDISHELDLAKESFTFPYHLSFAKVASPDETTPPLLFNKSNSGYHAQAHKLLQLLLAADGISSNGDREVRKKRKELVKRVEAAIEELELKRDEAWKQVRERRIRGEESDSEDDDSSTSCGSSVVAETEHIENVEDKNSKTEEGNDVSEPQEQTEQTEEKVDAEDKVEDDKDAEQKVEKREEKEEGYELL